MVLVNLIHAEFVERRFRAYVRSRETPLTPAWLADLRRLFVRSRGRCVYCGRIRGRFHLDHVTPLARGGPHTMRNFGLACSECNLTKNFKTAAEFGRPDLHVFEPDKSLAVFMDERRARLRKGPSRRSYRRYR